MTLSNKWPRIFDVRSWSHASKEWLECFMSPQNINYRFEMGNYKSHLAKCWSIRNVKNVTILNAMKIIVVLKWEIGFKGLKGVQNTIITVIITDT